MLSGVGQGSTGGGLPTSAPVVNSQTTTASTPAFAGQTVTTVTATNSPTSWAITAGNAAGDYAIDNTGKITFTSTGATDYNGNTAQQTATLTVQATNGIGPGTAGTVGITAYADGGANPVGTAQLPTILNKYHATGSDGRFPGNGRQPPWKVAGVDYYVGIPPGTTLTDWQSFIGAPGIDAGGVNYIRCNGTTAANPSASATINAADFTLHGGGWLYIPSGGCSSVTITNSKFGCATPTGSDGYYIQSQAATSFTLRFNEIDGLGCELGQVTWLSTGGNGTIIIEHNYFNNLNNHLWEQVSGTNTVTYRWNLINGWTAFDPTAHMNFHQLNSGNVTTSVLFNTVYIPQLGANGPGEMFQYYMNSSGTLTTPTQSYNTIISIQPGGQALPSTSYAVHGSVGSAGTTLSGAAFNQNNYFDPTSMYGAYYTGSMTTGWTSSGNIDMTTGAIITPP